MAKNIMIFGGGINQLTLIEAVNELGFTSITIDPNPDAIGKKYSKVFYIVDPKDYEKTKKIALDNKICGIVSGQMEKPMLMMSRLAQELNLIYHTPEVVERATNKYLMKQFFRLNKVPCAKGMLFESDITEEDLRSFNYPIIIKPKDSYSSRGVYKINSYNEIQNFIDETISFSSDGSVIVEEFLEGPEFSIESITFNNQTEIIQYTEKFITPYPNTVEIGHLQPAQLTVSDKNKINEVVKSGIKALGINNSASHTEIKLTANGPYILEIGARLGGDFISSYLTLASTGYNMDKAVVLMSIGEKPDIFKNRNKYSIIKYVELDAGKKINKIMDWTDILNKTEVIFADVFYKEGFIIPPIKHSALRAACFIVVGESREDVLNKAFEIENEFKSKFILQ